MSSLEEEVEAAVRAVSLRFIGWFARLLFRRDWPCAAANEDDDAPEPLMAWDGASRCHADAEAANDAVFVEGSTGQDAPFT